MELLDVFKALVSKNNNWDQVKDEDKEKNFFIINRLMSRKYRDKSQLLNSKTINKISSMDLWHHFIITQPYPNWFWQKNKKLEKSEIVDKDYKILLKYFQIKDIDLDYLIDKHPEFIKEELAWLKKVNNK